MDTEAISWTDWIESLRSMATTMFADARASGAGREADLAMKMFGTMMGAYLSHLSSDPAHPVFLPSAGYYTMYGSPNPDTVYRSAVVDDTRPLLDNWSERHRSRRDDHGFRGSDPKGPRNVRTV